MDPAAAFKFDLQGYLHIPAVLSAAEVAAANLAIDAHRSEFEGESGRSRPFAHIEGLLGWTGAEREPFVRMLAHSRIVPYLNMMCGKGSVPHREKKRDTCVR